MNLFIQTEIQNETVLFAKEELARYLKLLNRNIEIDDKAENGITLGLTKETDEEIDTVAVDVDGLSGEIRGSNYRSILFAAYRYLEALGIRWIRHGADGEVIPENHDFTSDSIHFESTAKSKYRGMCIEGAVTIENMLDNIDWVAKMGFNCYYIQFDCPHTFFFRWYTRSRNRYAESTARRVSFEEAEKYRVMMAEAIKKRGLFYQSMGHGWTALCLGLPGNGWWENKEEVGEELKQNLAMLDGKREFYKGIPLNTELCYSNPETRKKFVNFCADYAQKHSEMDVLHIWLSDGRDNHCECEECKKMLPSDFYVKLLNEIDAEYTARNISTKLVYLAYHDLLWAPEVEKKFNNPDRFILMFAPICRSYDTSYTDIKELPEKAPFVRNKNVLPSTVEGNVAHILDWVKTFHTNAFAYEYYYWVKQNYVDFGGINLSRVIYEDLQNHDKIGLSGIVSCQSQRSYWPNGLGMYVMAKALWHGDEIAFETMEEDHFRNEFGEYEGIFKEFYKTLSYKVKNHEGMKTLKEIKVIAEEMKKTIEDIQNNLSENTPLWQKKSIDYTEYYCKMLSLQMDAEMATEEKGMANAKEEWNILLTFLQKTEEEVQSVFDYQQYCSALEYNFEGFRDLHLVDWQEGVKKFM